MIRDLLSTRIQDSNATISNLQKSITKKVITKKLAVPNKIPC